MKAKCNKCVYMARIEKDGFVTYVFCDKIHDDVTDCIPQPKACRYYKKINKKENKK